MKRPDTIALVVGLMALAIAALGLWHAFGTVNWSAVGIAFPILLVLVGVSGLATTRPRS